MTSPMTSLTPILGWIPSVEALVWLIIAAKYRRVKESNERSRKKRGHLWKKRRRRYQLRYRNCAHCHDRARTYIGWKQQHVPFLCRLCLEELHKAKLSVGEIIRTRQYIGRGKDGQRRRRRI